MSAITINDRIDAPPAVVYRVFTQIDKAAERISGITAVELLSDGPFGVGTRWRETRRMMGRDETQELSVTAVDPGHSYEATCHACGCACVTRFEFVPVAAGDATEVQVIVTMKPLVWWARLLTPLGFLMSGPMKKLMLRDIRDLADVAEKQAKST